jgi:nitrogen regulatory protein PII
MGRKAAKRKEMTCDCLSQFQLCFFRERAKGGNNKMANKCILAMVKPNLTDQVVESAKKAGATGATIIPASGTGAGEAKTFFGLSLEIRTEVVLFLVSDTIVDAILNAIKEAGRFSEPGTGIAMVLPVEQTAGMESQMSQAKP